MTFEVCKEEWQFDWIINQNWSSLDMQMVHWPCSNAFPIIVIESISSIEIYLNDAQKGR